MLSSDPSFKPPVIPQQGIQPAPVTPPVPTTASPAATTTIPPTNIPKEPPAPAVTSTPVRPSPPPSSAPPPPPPPPTPAPAPKPRRFRRVRLLAYLATFLALAYAGGVVLALRQDNFHDFFTEYVPWGEDVVLYFEERSFRRRFPNAKTNTFRSSSAPAPAEEGKKVKIPLQSGLSWKTVDESKGSDLSQKGPHMSAKESQASKEEARVDQVNTTMKEKSAVVQDAKKNAPSEPPKKDLKPVPAAAPAVVNTPPTKPAPASSSSPAPAPASVASPSTKSDTRTPALSPVLSISPVTVPNGDEPVVQDMVKLINDLITVVNADGAETANKYSAPMQKAKDSVIAIAKEISSLRDAERKGAEERIREAHKEFDEGAKALLTRIETAQKEDDARYREEFEAERAKIAQQYENRLKAEVERTQQVLQQQHKNELAEQAIKMKQHFIDDVKGLVEAERDGRLSKITDLSTNVDSLTQLTSNWNGIIDANLATQKLQVAVDAVRSALEQANHTHKPTPFVREMAALKLVADNDPIVDAAVASINPSAYQKGIPSSAQLIDRFRRVAGEVRKASLLPENAGIASHAASLVLSKVMFKKQGVPEGNDVESVLTRTETLLEEGDLDNAAREMNELKGWAGVLSRDWLNDVRKVLEVQQALDVIETEARLQCLRVE